MGVIKGLLIGGQLHTCALKFSAYGKNLNYYTIYMYIYHVQQKNIFQTVIHVYAFFM